MQTKDFPAWLLLASFALLLFTFGIGSYPLTDRDETLYSEVARECVQTGDWITLHWQGKPWFIHAPLAMWIQAAGFRVLGVSELTARLPSALFGVGLVLITGAFGAMLFGRRAGLVSGLILATSPIFFVIARMAILDMPFAFFITLSIYLFVRAWREGNPKLYPAFWLATGLATLTKGLWGLVLSLMVCSLYAIGDRKRGRLLDWRLYASSVSWAAVVMPWIIAGTARHGRDFLGPVFITNTYARLTTSVCEHAGPWWFYLPIIAIGLFPWIVLRPGALFQNRGEGSRLLLMWILPALVLYSSARTKLPNYLLPLMPALAIALGASIAESKRLCVQAILLPILGVAIAFGIAAGLRRYQLFSGSGPPVGLMLFIAAAYSVAGIGLLLRREAGIVLTAVSLALVLFLLPLGYMRMSDQLSPKRIALQARSLAGSGPVFIIHLVSCEDGIYFYSREPFVTAPNLDRLARMLAERRGDHALVVSNEQFRELCARGLKLHIFARNPKWILAKATGS